MLQDPLGGSAVLDEQMSQQDVYEDFIRQPSGKANEIGKRKPYYQVLAEKQKKAREDRKERK